MVELPTHLPWSICSSNVWILYNPYNVHSEAVLCHTVWKILLTAASVCSEQKNINYTNNFALPQYLLGHSVITHKEKNILH